MRSQKKRTVLFFLYSCLAVVVLSLLDDFAEKKGFKLSSRSLIAALGFAALLLFYYFRGVLIHDPNSSKR